MINEDILNGLLQELTEIRKDIGGICSCFHSFLRLKEEGLAKISDINFEISELVDEISSLNLKMESKNVK